MKILYNFLVHSTSFILPIVGLFNKKIKLFVEGRKQVFSKITALNKAETIWFHAASLGEFEQAIPLIEEIKNRYPSYKILVTFFSPSGYEIRKNYVLADVVSYMPLDTKQNAKKFIESFNLKIAIFIKYEFWPNFLYELKKHKITTLLVSGILRENQLFFKSYGGFMRNSLKAFHHFFVQNKTSKDLLNSIKINSVTISGDTRFDRVIKILNQDTRLDFIDTFKNNQFTIVAGSTWKEDETLLIEYINSIATEDQKFIIAPHNIKKESILELKKAIHKNTVLYSTRENKRLEDYQVFIIDTIGILTKVYAVAEVAYVGGGLKTGLHNILEPATFRIPVVIGNKFSKFNEAKELVKKGGCFSISNQNQFNTILNQLKNDKNFREKAGEINTEYIQEHLGATKTILNYLESKL